MGYEVGQRVRLLRDIWEDGEDLPPGVIARRGAELVVRKIGDGPFPLHVSHEEITDRTFGVRESEVEPTPTHPNT